MPLEISITNEEKVHVKLNPVSSTGKPKQLDGPATFSVVSGDATAIVDGDGRGAQLISGENPGDTTFLVEADADLGEGKVTIQDTITLRVLGSLAANLGLVAEPPTPKE